MAGARRVKSNFHLIRRKKWPRNHFELTVSDLYFKFIQVHHNTEIQQAVHLFQVTYILSTRYQPKGYVCCEKLQHSRKSWSIRSTFSTSTKQSIVVGLQSVNFQILHQMVNPMQDIKGPILR